MIKKPAAWGIGLPFVEYFVDIDIQVNCTRGCCLGEFENLIEGGDALSMGLNGGSGGIFALST